MNCPHCNNEIPDGSVFCNHCGMSTQAAPQATATRRLGRILGGSLIPLLLVVLAIFLFIRYTAGNKTASTLVATVAHTSITLRDETTNLPASSWRSIPAQLPYNGSLDVSLRVLRGNPLDVFLVTSSEMEAMKGTNDWTPYQGSAEFRATKTATYHRTAPLNEGTYFIVLRDRSLGILSQSASDVAVKIVLNP
jgi:hypothetical protein